MLPPPPPPSGPVNWGAPTTLASNAAITTLAAAVASDGAATVAWPQTQLVLPGAATPSPVPYVVTRRQAVGSATWDAVQLLE